MSNIDVASEFNSGSSSRHTARTEAAVLDLFEDRSYSLSDGIKKKPQGRKLNGVPVFSLNGDYYLQYKIPNKINWEFRELWNKHTVSSKAKDWGKIRAAQSLPINTLYKRHTSFERVPAFKLYAERDLQDVMIRLQRATKSATLHMRKTSDPNQVDVHSQQLDWKSEATPQEKALIERLLAPTSASARRRDLTLQYKCHRVEPLPQLQQ